MKKSLQFYLMCFLVVGLSNILIAQNITITDDENYTPDNAAILDVKSTSKGVLFPRLTDEERDALYQNASEGLMIYNTIDQQLQIFIGNNWYPLSMGTPEPGLTVTDYDGTVYSTIKIGSQIWMAENLKTTHYSDGTALVDGTSAGDISGDYTTKYYFWYNNDSTSYAGTYGALYTWAAIMNGSASSSDDPSGVQGVCPTGWHVPSNAEWTELISFLTDNGYGYEGSGSDIAKSLAATSGWDANGTLGNIGNDQASNNSSEFTALPAASRNYDGSFISLGYYAGFWSTTEYDGTNSWNYYLRNDYSEMFSTNNLKTGGFSIRCIKD